MQHNEIRNIAKELEHCNKCHNKSGPFYFTMNGTAKVMLITLSPSFQAVYRPLESTRFFRVLCLALFGLPSQDRDSQVEKFTFGEIYWTHYYKCYYDRSKSNDLPPKDCCDRYLFREIKALDPTLIIILGRPVAECLIEKAPEEGQILEAELQGYPCICANFPKYGTEPEFATIRTRLQQYIDGVDVSIVPDDLEFKSIDDKGMIAVHANFELRGLEEYWKLIDNTPTDLYNTTDIDSTWYYTEMIPRWQRYSFIIFCYSFLEDQLKAVLSHIKEKDDNLRQPVIALFHLLAKKYGQEKALEKDWKLIDDLKTLTEERNYIVHQGGRVNSSDYDRNYQGKLIHPDNSGMIPISRDYCEQVLDILRRVINKMIDFEEQSYHRIQR